MRQGLDMTILTCIDRSIKLVYMSFSIGSFDAKTHLSEYLERVRQGESFLISRHGKAIAELKPVGSKQENLAQILGNCSALRKRLAGENKTFPVSRMVREDRDR
jgi:prevent-host-death family protein